MAKKHIWQKLLALVLALGLCAGNLSLPVLAEDNAPLEQTQIMPQTPEEVPAPVEEAPAEEKMVEEAPAEETPVEVPVAEAPAEEMIVEEIPVEETPVEEAPVEEIPAEQIPEALCLDGREEEKNATQLQWRGNGNARFQGKNITVSFVCPKSGEVEQHVFAFHDSQWVNGDEGQVLTVGELMLTAGQMLDVTITWDEEGDEQIWQGALVNSTGAAAGNNSPNPGTDSYSLISLEEGAVVVPTDNPGHMIREYEEEPPKRRSSTAAVTRIEEEAVPLGGSSETELPEEGVPLAQVPETGDASRIWGALTALGLAGSCLLRKRENGE